MEYIGEVKLRDEWQGTFICPACKRFVETLKKLGYATSEFS
jgi:hypothetical protein